jgi:ATP-dependent DNA ligase
MQPMLAQLARELPLGDYLYEPKWDGFRCVATCSRGQVDLRSRNGRPLARYFPEIVEALVGYDAMFDGELMVPAPDGSDFAALLNRLHPSTRRVQELRRATPASYMIFDLLTAADRPFAARRESLERVQLRAPLALTPVTSDPQVARRWLAAGAGIDGVVAKRRDQRYEPGRRGWTKIKPQHTVDCVVGGFRALLESGAVASLLLGLFEDGALFHVGVASQFSAAQRRQLFLDLLPLAAPLRGHPWENGFNLGRSPVGRLPGSAGRWVAAEMTQDWVPLRPVRVCEVAYDKLDGIRFRHPARFLRWRPDRDPQTCRTDQLAC